MERILSVLGDDEGNFSVKEKKVVLLKRQSLDMEEVAVSKADKLLILSLLSATPLLCLNETDEEKKKDSGEC